MDNNLKKSLKLKTKKNFINVILHQLHPRRYFRKNLTSSVKKVYVSLIKFVTKYFLRNQKSLLLVSGDSRVLDHSLPKLLEFLQEP